MPAVRPREAGAGRVTAWKRTERRVAAELGGVRVPVTGRARGDAPDIAHDRLSLEVKHRAALPAWLTDALERARASSRDGRIPVARPHASGTRYADAVRLVARRDLRPPIGAQATPEREAGNIADRNTTPGRFDSRRCAHKKGESR